MKTFIHSLYSFFLILLVALSVSSCKQSGSDKKEDSRENMQQADNSLNANDRLNNSSSAEQNSNEQVNEYADSKITYKVVPGINNTWGYEIYNEEKMMISQKSIPALPGNDGFKTQEQAVEVAELVIGKIKRGEMPPTVSVEELSKIGIKKD